MVDGGESRPADRSFIIIRKTEAFLDYTRRFTDAPYRQLTPRRRVSRGTDAAPDGKPYAARGAWQWKFLMWDRASALKDADGERRVSLGSRDGKWNLTLRRRGRQSVATQLPRCGEHRATVRFFVTSASGRVDAGSAGADGALMAEAERDRDHRL